MIVVDASAITESLLQTALGSRLEARLLRDGDEFHAPHLLDVEVARALRRLVRAGDVPADRALEALADLADFDLRRHSHHSLPLSRLGSARQPHGIRRDVRGTRRGDRRPAGYL